MLPADFDFNVLRLASRSFTWPEFALLIALLGVTAYVTHRWLMPRLRRPVIAERHQVPATKVEAAFVPSR